MTPSDHWLERRTGIAPTEHPAQQLSTRSVLDEATRPSAPEPDSTTSFTPHGIAVGSHLVGVHDLYRAEMAQVQQVLEQVRRGTQEIGDARAVLNAMTIRANDWTLGGICQAHCRFLTQHHEMESGSIFPHLRRSQESLGPVLDRLHKEHLAIHDLVEEVDAALVHLVQNPTDYSRIAESIDLLADTIQSHFAYEEQELIAPLARHGFYPGQV